MGTILRRGFAPKAHFPHLFNLVRLPSSEIVKLNSFLLELFSCQALDGCLSADASVPIISGVSIWVYTNFLPFSGISLPAALS